MTVPAPPVDKRLVFSRKLVGVATQVAISGAAVFPQRQVVAVALDDEPHLRNVGVIQAIGFDALLRDPGLQPPQVLNASDCEKLRPIRPGMRAHPRLRKTSRAVARRRERTVGRACAGLPQVPPGKQEEVPADSCQAKRNLQRPPLHAKRP